MIEITLTGNLPPDFKEMDFTESLGKIAFTLQQSIKHNFEMGGVPRAWAQIKRTGQPSNLFKTGALLNQIQEGVEPLRAWAGIPDGQETAVIYARTHQWGDSRRNIPARPYIMFQEEDIAFVKQELVGALTEFFHAKGTPL